MLEVPASEMEPSRAAFLQSQVEVVEEEEEYTGKLWQSHHVVPFQSIWENAALTRGVMRPDPAQG